MATAQTTTGGSKEIQEEEVPRMKRLNLVFLLDESRQIAGNINNNEAFVRQSIEEGADVNVSDEYGRTPLFFATVNNREEIVRLLIEKGADVNQSNKDGQTPLFYAAKNNNKLITRLLVREKADVNAYNKYGRTALFPAAENENEEIARLLIEKGADVNVSDIEGQTPLFLAAENKNEEVAQLLIEKGADVNHFNKDGQTPLYFAAKNTNKRIARLLIDEDADVNALDRYGRTPLFSAAENNNEEVAQLFLERGADVNAFDKHGRTPLFTAAENDSEDVARLLIEKGANINASDKDGNTPFSIALQYDNQQVAYVLFISKADVNIPDQYGRTALFYLAGLCEKDIQSYEHLSDIKRNLTNKVASASNNIDRRDREDRTALSHAIETVAKSKEYEQVVQILIKHRANVNIPDDKGQTPLFYALTPSAVRLLLENDADFSVRNTEQETAMINAVRTCQTAQQFLDIASILVEHGAVLNDTDSCNVSVLSHFLERHCCKEFKQDDEANDVITQLTIFKENGTKDSDIFFSALNYLYAILPKYLCSPNAVITEKGKEIFSNAVAVGIKHASDSELKNLEKLKAVLDNNRIAEALDILTTLGVNPNSVDSHGNTALHYAVILPFQGVSQQDVKKILLTVRKHGVRFNVKNKEMETPLHMSLSERSWEQARANNVQNEIKSVVEICSFLLNNGALISERTKSEETVYHLIMSLFQEGLSSNKEIREVVCVSALQLLELFSKSAKQSKVLKKADFQQNSPLHLWASLSLPPNQSYEDKVTKDFTFQTLLETILKHLLMIGMTPNPRNEDEQTPLHLCKTWTAVKLLIDAGANTNDLDREGRPPILNVARQVVPSYIRDKGRFFPDIQKDQKEFLETCVSLGLDIWRSNNQGQCILSIFLDSESYTLAKAMIDITVIRRNSTKIIKQLVDTVCKDESTSTNWKSLLTITLLTSSNLASNINLDDALRHICTNIEKLRSQGQYFGIEEGCKPVEPPFKKTRVDDTEELANSARKSHVYIDIARQLLFYGADGNCLCDDFPNLRSFLTSTISPDQMKKIIPWTSHSKTHKDKLKVVSRKQNVVDIGNYFFHIEPIGYGGFGEVYAGICKNDAREVAIKKINKSLCKRPHDEREISNLIELTDCQQVVNYISYEVSDKDFGYIVLELMEGHLDDYFESPSFDASRSGKLCRHVVKGLKYLHDHKPEPILHRDLKPDNILYKFDTYGKVKVKIADFGLSSPLTSGKTTVLSSTAGTRCWIAPEVIRSQPYRHFTWSDVFSCGLICHYILSKQKHPFSPVDISNKTTHEREIETEYNMGYERMTMEGWHHALSPEATHFIKGMLQKDETHRPSAADSLRHPFFWSNKKKMEFLNAVGNQNEFQCPSTIQAVLHYPMTAVEADLKSNLANIVKCAKWDDPNYKDMAKVVAEMKNPIEKVNKNGKTYLETPRTYNTGSILELVRFIRNAIAHVSEASRPPQIKQLILEEFVFLKEFPHLLIEVYNAVTRHGWDARKEIKYAMEKKEQQ